MTDEKKPLSAWHALPCRGPHAQLFVIGDVYPDLIDPLAYRLTVQDDAWWAIDAEPLPCRGEDQRHFDDRKRALLINLFHWNEVVEQVREIKATSKSDDAGFQEGTSL